MSRAIERPRRVGNLILSGLLFALLGTAAQAQDIAGRPKVKIVRADPGVRRSSRADRSAAVHSLTINRRSESAPIDDLDEGENSATVDGPIRYNSISTFDPVPYVDSGMQYPYGLDGVGGYGSDFGVQAGQDTALTQPGP